MTRKPRLEAHAELDCADIDDLEVVADFADLGENWRDYVPEDKEIPRAELRRGTVFLVRFPKRRTA